MTTEEKKKYENLIQAFALGALDKEEFIETVHAIESSDDFAWQELGEYQNLTSLLVSFIDPREVPAHSLERILTRIDETGSPMPSPATERKTISFTKLSSFVDDAADTPESEGEPSGVDGGDLHVDPYAIGRNGQSRPVINRQPGFQRPGVHTQMAGRGAAEPAPRPEIDERPSPASDEQDYEPGIEEEARLMPHISRESITGPEPEFFPERTTEEKYQSASFGMTIEEPQDEDAPRGPINPRRAQRKQLIEQEVQAAEETVSNQYTSPGVAEPSPSQGYDRERGSSRFPGVAAGGGGVTSTAFWGVTGVVVVTFSVVIYIMFSMVSSAEEKLDAKIKELGTAQAKTELLRSTVTMNQNLLLFFSSVKTAGLVNLYGSDDYPETFGKFFYGVKEKRGFLQFTNITSFNAGKGFQLWIQVGGAFKKAGGVNVPDQNIEFFELSEIPDLAQSGTYKVILTEENVSGADTPSNTVIMTGLLIMKAKETN